MDAVDVDLAQRPARRHRRDVSDADVRAAVAEAGYEVVA